MFNIKEADIIKNITEKHPTYGQMKKAKLRKKAEPPTKVGGR